MTLLQIRNKRDRLEKQMYKEISHRNFDKADELRKKIVDLDVKDLALRIK